MATSWMIHILQPAELPSSEAQLPFSSCHLLLNTREALSTLLCVRHGWLLLSSKNQVYFVSLEEWCLPALFPPILPRHRNSHFHATLPQGIYSPTIYYRVELPVSWAIECGVPMWKSGDLRQVCGKNSDGPSSVDNKTFSQKLAPSGLFLVFLLQLFSPKPWKI